MFAKFVKALIKTLQKFFAPNTAPSTGDLKICFLKDYLFVLYSVSKVKTAMILTIRLIILKKNPTRNTTKESNP